MNGQSILRCWKWLPLILWMIAVFLVSNQPKAAIPRVPESVQERVREGLVWPTIDLDVLVKKGGHVVAFGLMALFGWYATGSLWWAFTIAAAYAVTDEIHQIFILERTARFSDVLLDCLGAGLTVIGLHYRARWLGWLGAKG